MDAALIAVDAPPETSTDAGPGVSLTTRILVDTSRGTPANGTAPASSSRSLPTDVWYPTQAATSPFAMDAPIDASRAPYPLVMFVHGSTSTRAQSRSLMQGLAAAGYVVMAADFPLTAFSTPGGASDLHADEQVLDLEFLADRMRSFAADPHDAFYGAVDATKYSVIGHSTGGTVALLALFAPDMHDARVQSAVALAPCACFFGTSFFQTRALPLLVLAGTDDLFVPVSTNGARAYALASAPRVMVTLLGGTHLYFTDIRLSDTALMPMPTTMDSDLAVTLARYGNGSDCAPIPAPRMDPMMTLEAQHARTLAWSRAFLDATLRASPAGLTSLEGAGDPMTVVAHDGI
jgi:predicted dienelactone hydrolase